MQQSLIERLESENFKVHKKATFDFEKFFEFIKWEVDGGRAYEESWIAYVEDTSIPNSSKSQGQFDFDFAKQYAEEVSNVDITISNMDHIQWWKIVREYIQDKIERYNRVFATYESKTHFAFKEILPEPCKDDNTPPPCECVGIEELF